MYKINLLWVDILYSDVKITPKVYYIRQGYFAFTEPSAKVFGVFLICLDRIRVHHCELKRI